MTNRLDEKPRTLKEMAIYYCVSVNTFKKWLALNPELSEIKRENGSFYFSIKSVKKIIAILGD